MGGGIDIQDEATLDIEETVFLDNRALFYGAGVSSLFSKLLITKGYGERNRCDFDGGVVYSIFSTIEIKQSHFLSNSGVSGGVISCLSNSTCISSTNQYTTNSVSHLSPLLISHFHCFFQATYGGVVFISLSSFVSKSDIFFSNSASSGAVTYSSDFLILEFSNVTATHGQALTGGVMTLTNGKILFINDGIFTMNQAQNSGGALYLINIEIVSITRVKATDNHASIDGGCVAVYGGIQSELLDNSPIDMKLFIQNSSFARNSVQRRGGAIYGNNLYELLIIETVFLMNTALYGGAVSTTQSTGNISLSQFINNSALVGGGGVFWIYEANGPMVSTFLLALTD
jgi:hypothetical protein